MSNGESKEETSAQHKCMRCSATSQSRALISVEFKGQSQWICAACLPYFIHGG
ncbi:MAG: hypothetical protein HYU86_11880 [Chloroflexi bacterium]|nr:hypothetical protein [Chloroflexota bacterium]